MIKKKSNRGHSSAKADNGTFSDMEKKKTSGQALTTMRIPSERSELRASKKQGMSG